jgi:hypothetical protein
MKKLRKIKNWFKNIPVLLSKKFIGDFHPQFLELMQRSSFVDNNIFQELSGKRAKELIRIISSPKYKKYFYKAVAYNPQHPEEIKILRTKWEKTLDKIEYFISKVYVFLFVREVYNNIKSFEKISKNIIVLNSKIDEYFAKTTVIERLERAYNIGIISKVFYLEDIGILSRKISVKE